MHLLQSLGLERHPVVVDLQRMNMKAKLSDAKKIVYHCDPKTQYLRHGEAEETLKQLNKRINKEVVATAIARRGSEARSVALAIHDGDVDDHGDGGVADVSDGPNSCEEETNQAMVLDELTHRLASRHMQAKQSHRDV